MVNAKAFLLEMLSYYRRRSSRSPQKANMKYGLAFLEASLANMSHHKQQSQLLCRRPYVAPLPRSARTSSFNVSHGCRTSPGK